MVSPFEEGTCHLPIFLLCVPIVLLASKCLACQLPTPGIDIHLRQTIPSQQNPISPQWTYPHKIGVWSSTNLLRTTLRLGNTGNQGMLFLPKTPHISLRVGRRWSNCPTMVRIIHLERLESTIGESWTTFWKLAKYSEIGTWTGSRKYFGKGYSISQPPKTRDEMPISTIYQKPRYEPTYSKYIWVRVICCA